MMYRKMFKYYVNDVGDDLPCLHFKSLKYNKYR